MNKIKGSPIFNTSLFEFLLVNGFLIFIYIRQNFNLELFILIISIVNVILFIKESGKMHFFLYDEEKVIIKNSWNPFIEFRININDIEEIKVEYRSYSGYAITFILKGKNKRIFNVMNISKIKIDDMIKEMRKNFTIPHN
jgi:hypothetical protein